MMLWLLGLATAAFMLWLLWLLTDGARAALARRAVEARKRATREPLHLVVTARQDASPDLFQLTLARCDGRRLPRFRAGQYLTLRTPVGARRYSLAAWTARSHEYRLGIRRVEGGKVSSWLHEHARPGVNIEALPPAGDFILACHAGEVVLVAGGIGITPLAAMVDAWLAKPRGRLWLFHAARHEAELADHARYTELERRQPGFHYRPVLSRPAETWSGGRGRLNAADLIRELADPAAAHYYLCARPEMMDALSAGLAALGAPDAAIHHESFGGADNSDTNEYRVEVIGHGAHVFRGEPSLLHALEGWGVPVQADCRAGECGACGINVVHGAVRACQVAQIPAPPGRTLACCAVPASDLRISL
jgi:ferredoxin-NADP reductase